MMMKIGIFRRIKSALISFSVQANDTKFQNSIWNSIAFHEHRIICNNNNNNHHHSSHIHADFDSILPKNRQARNGKVLDYS